MKNINSEKSKLGILRKRLREAYVPIATTLIRLLSILRGEDQSIRNADKYLEFMFRSAQLGAHNLTRLEVVDQESFDERLQNAADWDWVQTGDYHYFVSRVLFLNHVAQYSFFSAHQCIENYLKGYLASRGLAPPIIHSLSRLLDICREAAPHSHLFIFSRQCEVAVDRYDPFYQLPRYPVIRYQPEDGKYLYIHPTDIQVLDYFVLRMRELLSIPNNTWDIFRNGHYYLDTCKRNSPWFYQYFSLGNINHGNSFD